MGTKKEVIILTDGDRTAYRALSEACEDLACHPLRASEGNPTPLDGQKLVEAVKAAPRSPVVVMVDDRGDAGHGDGEDALDALIHSEAFDILGVVAVAANTHPVKGTRVAESVTLDGEVIEGAVDKGGHPSSGMVVKGDTVDVLEDFDGLVVGLGDPGKMGGHDSISRGVPATRRALEEILKKRGGDDGR